MDKYTLLASPPLYTLTRNILCSMYNTDMKIGLAEENLVKEDREDSKSVVDSMGECMELFRSGFYYSLLEIEYKVIVLFMVGILYTLWMDDYIIIWIIIVFNIMMKLMKHCYINRYKISYKSYHKSTVIRNNMKLNVLSSELVVGDILILKKYNYIYYVDCIVLESTYLYMNENNINGNNNVKKIYDINNPCNILKEYRYVYDSSTVINGEGLAIVIATGEDTEYNKKKKNIILKSNPTYLELKLQTLSYYLSMLCLLITSIFIGIGIWDQRSYKILVLDVVSLFFIIIPEDLSLMARCILSIGLSKLNSCKLLVKNIVTVASLGAITTILIDKTNLLTTNDLVIETIGMYDKCTERADLEDDLIDTTYLQPLLHCWAHSISPLDLPSVALIQRLQRILDHETSPEAAYKLLQESNPDIIESLNAASPFDKAFIKFVFEAGSITMQQFLNATESAVCSVSPSTPSTVVPSTIISDENQIVNFSYDSTRKISSSLRSKQTRELCDSQSRLGSLVPSNTSSPGRSFKILQLKSHMVNPPNINNASFPESTTPSEYKVTDDPPEYSLYSRGDFEFIISRSVGFLVQDGRSALFTAKQKQGLLSHLRSLSETMNIIAFASRQLPFLSSATNWENLVPDELEQELMFVGYVAFIDPIKEDICSTIYELQMASIDIKLVSDDTKHNCLNVAKQVGLTVSKNLTKLNPNCMFSCNWTEEIENVPSLNLYTELSSRLSFKPHLLSPLKSNFMTPNNSKSGYGAFSLTRPMLSDHFNETSNSSASSSVAASTILKPVESLGIVIDSLSLSDYSAMNSAEFQGSLDTCENVFDTFEKNLVFSGLSSNQKEILVKNLQDNMCSVLYISDNISDCNAVRVADIGVASYNWSMADSILASSGMVLFETDFNLILTSIKEGRTFLENLKKTISYSLASKLALILIYFYSLCSSKIFPFYIFELIILELLLDTSVAFMYISEIADPNIMSRKPKQFVFDLQFLFFIFLGGFLLALNVILVYSAGYILTQNDLSADYRLTVQNMCFISWIIGHILLAFVMRSKKVLFWNKSITSNLFLIKFAAVAISFLILIYVVNPFHSILYLKLLSRDFILTALFMPFIIVLIYEAVKYFINIKF